MSTRVDEIAKLVQNLASEITIIEPGNTADIESLDKLISQVRQQLSQAEGLDAQLVKAALSETDSASHVIAGLLTQSDDDIQNSLDSATKSICALQKLIDDSASLAPQPPLPPQTSQPEQAAADQTIISDEDAPLVRDFISEAQEHIENSEAALLQIEQGTGDAETINLIFRAFHTVKGMAGFLNLKQIGTLAHAAEGLLDRARKGTLELKGPSLELVFTSVDVLKKMIASLKDSLDSQKPVPNVDNSVLLQDIQACMDGKLQASAPEKEPASQPAQAPSAPVSSAPVYAAQETSQGTSAKPVSAGDDKIKVSTAKLDVLVNMIGELVIAQSMVYQQVRGTFAPEHDLCRKAGHQGKIIRELQEISMSLRMVPIQGLFQKMARLVRDLSHKAGKQIDFKVSGEETEIDRNIVELLSDPLVHMIRNSVDHGIEPVQVRQQAAKPAAGQIELRAFHQGGNIVIEIADDGAGLNRDKILNKAIDSGLIQPGQELSDQDIFKLIFHAGLSTAEKVTDISGRGVGMDVVRKNIEALRGKIEISSEIGKGTVFTIRLPLTLAIIDGQIVRIGSHKYIIPTASIEHSIRPTAQQISTVQGKGELVNIRGSLIPLVRLYDKFKIDDAITDPTQTCLVVIEGDNKKCCIMVDEILGQQQVVIKSLGEGLGTLKGISGAAIMGDGSISLIMDASGLIEQLGTSSGTHSRVNQPGQPGPSESGM